MFGSRCGCKEHVGAGGATKCDPYRLRSCLQILKRKTRLQWLEGSPREFDLGSGPLA